MLLPSKVYDTPWIVKIPNTKFDNVGKWILVYPDKKMDTAWKLANLLYDKLYGIIQMKCST